MKKETWIVVANSSHARIFRAESNHTLVEIEVMDHPESRQKDGDLVSSKPGRQFDRNGPGRHAMEPQTSPKAVEFETFARLLSTRLDAAREYEHVGKIYLSANPGFLGILRQSLSASTTSLIAAEIDKDMTHLDSTSIRNHLPLVL